MLEIFNNTKAPDQAIPFDQIKSEEFEIAIDQALTLAKQKVSAIESNSQPNFKNTIEALELSSSELDQITTVFFNLYHACTDQHIDSMVGSISEKLAKFGNDIQLSEALFKKIKTVYENTDRSKLNNEQLKLLETASKKKEIE